MEKPIKPVKPLNPGRFTENKPKLICDKNVDVIKLLNTIYSASLNIKKINHNKQHSRSAVNFCA